MTNGIKLMTEPKVTEDKKLRSFNNISMGGDETWFVDMTEFMIKRKAELQKDRSTNKYMKKRGKPKGTDPIMVLDSGDLGYNCECEECTELQREYTWTTGAGMYSSITVVAQEFKADHPDQLGTQKDFERYLINNTKKHKSNKRSQRSSNRSQKRSSA